MFFTEISFKNTDDSLSSTASITKRGLLSYLLLMETIRASKYILKGSTKKSKVMKKRNVKKYISLLAEKFDVGDCRISAELTVCFVDIYWSNFRPSNQHSWRR